MPQQPIATDIDRSADPNPIGTTATTGTTATAATKLPDSGRRIDEVLDLLDDADCRAILEATGGEALSAAEIQETCDIPRSTVYRKLEQLTGAGLLAERLRIRRSGKHTREYLRIVEDVVFSMDTDDGVALQISRREPVPERMSLQQVAGD